MANKRRKKYHKSYHISYNCGVCSSKYQIELGDLKRLGKKLSKLPCTHISLILEFNHVFAYRNGKKYLISAQHPIRKKAFRKFCQAYKARAARLAERAAAPQISTHMGSSTTHNTYVNVSISRSLYRNE